MNYKAAREDHERAIREIPRDPEVIELFKKLVGAGPLPPPTGPGGRVFMPISSP